MVRRNTAMDFPASLIKSLRTARKIVALTGAGISAESGLATFRDAQTGLWSKFKPEELATAEAFQRNPKLVSDWYSWRRKQALQAQPNAGHLALSEMEKHAPQFLLVTQNVDGLHARAGSRQVVELHGNIHRFRCFENDCPSENFDIPHGRCGSCGGHLRPAVVWFGEPLDPDVVVAAEGATFCDVFLTIGTSAVVYPAAGLIQKAKRRGAFTVEINTEDTPASAMVDVAIRAPAAEALQNLALKINSSGNPH